MNIIRVEYIGDGRLSMVMEVADKCYSMHLPEYAFVKDIACSSGGWSTVFPIEIPRWHGNASGHTYEPVLKSKVLPLTTGKADLLFTWEDGGRTALRVHDGVVHEIECVIVIGFRPLQVELEATTGVRTWTGTTNAFPIRASWEGTDA